MGMLPHYLVTDYLTSSERSCIPPTGSAGCAGDVALQQRTSFRTSVNPTMAGSWTGHVSSLPMFIAIADLQYRSRRFEGIVSLHDFYQEKSL